MRVFFLEDFPCGCAHVAAVVEDCVGPKLGVAVPVPGFCDLERGVGAVHDPKAGTITFAAYFDQWSERQVWVQGTVDAMQLAAGSITFGDMPMRSIRRSHIETWVKKMTAGGLAPGTVTTRYKNVRSVFRAAQRDRIIGADPTDGISLPRRRRAEAAMRIPMPEAVGAIMATADPRFATFVALCAFAGLRLGEAAALKVDNIDFLRRTLSVSRQAQHKRGGGVEIRPPKYGSERVVYLPESLLNMLAAHVERGIRPHGCSSEPATARRVGTTFGTSGTRRRAQPRSRASGCMICGISTPPA